MRKLRSLDILTSALNEEQSIVPLYERLKDSLSDYSNLEWKLHFVDNGSSDSTWSKIQFLNGQDSRVVGYKMSRTFLFDSAISAALDQADSDAVVIMCSDLQDPPEVIPSLISGYEAGFDQVVVKISSRKGTPLLIRFFSALFYHLAASFTSGAIPRNVSDFRLASRKCYEAARSLREANRFIRGQFSWVGFNTQTISMNRPPREFGKSKFLQFPKWRAIWLAVHSLFSYSSVPLALIALIGAASSFLSFVATIVFVSVWLFSGVPFAGYGTIVGSIVLGFSVVFLLLGIIAIYISSIYEEVKKRPMYIISEQIGQS